MLPTLGPLQRIGRKWQEMTGFDKRDRGAGRPDRDSPVPIELQFANHADPSTNSSDRMSNAGARQSADLSDECAALVRRDKEVIRVWT